MADEMDLLERVKDVAPLRAGAFDEARSTLRAVMAASASQETQPRRLGHRPRRTVGARGQAGLVLAAAAAVVAAVLVVTSSSPAPRHPAASGNRVTANHTSTAKPAGKPALKPAVPTVHPQLTLLADYLTRNKDTLPGDASLEIRNQSPSDATPGDNGVDLVTDSGDYYWALTESGLPQMIAGHEEAGAGMYKREMAVALYALNGDIATARARMAVANYAPGFNPNSPKHEIYPAGSSRKPLTPEQQREHTDNMIWLNCWNALNAGAGNPRVRAGVLRIMATMPLVTVKHTITDGQPTLTLTDGWPELAGSFREVLVINATTGLPVVSMTLQPGQPPAGVTYYHVSRVTVANIAAGKF